MTQEIMPYTRDTSKLEIDPPLYTFSGDENVSLDAYESATRNIYLRKVPFAASLMDRFKIPFDSEDHERIKRMMVCMGWLDHLLDEAPDRSEARRSYEDAVSSLSQQAPLPELPEWTRPELRNSVLIARNALAPLPLGCISSVVQKALRIGEISGEKAVIRRSKEYAAILTEEGSLSSDVVIECLSEAARKAGGYQKLHRWNKKAMMAATLLDAAIDLKQDYANSLTLLNPSLWNRLYLYGRAFSYLPSVIKGLGAHGIRTGIRVGLN